MIRVAASALSNRALTPAADFKTVQKDGKDVLALTDEQWADIDSDKCCSKYYSRAQMTDIRETLRVAVLYALGYLYEHREEADHHALTLSLRSLLFGCRQEGF